MPPDAKNLAQRSDHPADPVVGEAEGGSEGCCEFHQAGESASSPPVGKLVPGAKPSFRPSRLAPAPRKGTTRPWAKAFAITGTSAEISGLTGFIGEVNERFSSARDPTKDEDSGASR